MAKLQSITVNRYKAFKERTDLRTAPITILIGKNGSGKSVLTRLILILSDSMNRGVLNVPINLDALGVRHSSEFSDLPFARSSLPFEIGFSARAADDEYSLLAKIRYVKEREHLILEECRLSKNGNGLVAINLRDDSQLTSENPKYTLLLAGAQPEDYSGIFEGILPGFTDDRFSACSDAINILKEALPTASYLGPFRSEDGYFVGAPRPGLQDLGARGENTLELISADAIRGGGALLKTINEWFQDSLGHSVRIDKKGDYSKLFLAPNDDGVEVSLSETGAGFSQVLPIIAQNSIAQNRGAVRNVLVVEQPELHLHPAIHGAVADIIIATASQGNSTVFVETHSEQFILRIRRRLAEGKIKPEDVLIWSVGHSGASQMEGVDVAEIQLDEDGTPDDWPEGVFEESFDELGKLRSAVRGRQT